MISLLIMSFYWSLPSRVTCVSDMPPTAHACLTSGQWALLSYL